jgi:hypothetical protein
MEHQRQQLQRDENPRIPRFTQKKDWGAKQQLRRDENPKLKIPRNPKSTKKLTR